MKRIFLAALATAVLGGATGCQDAGMPGGNKVSSDTSSSSNAVSTAEGTLVSLKVPNMT